MMNLKILIIGILMCLIMLTAGCTTNNDLDNHTLNNKPDYNGTLTDVEIIITDFSGSHLVLHFDSGQILHLDSEYKQELFIIGDYYEVWVWDWLGSGRNLEKIIHNGTVVYERTRGGP